MHVYALDFDRADSLRSFFTLDRPGEYTLAAECESFTGDFSFELYEA